MNKIFKTSTENEGNDGTIWSRKSQGVAVVITTFILAVANYAPAIAAGISSFGK